MTPRLDLADWILLAWTIGFLWLVDHTLRGLIEWLRQRRAIQREQRALRLQTVARAASAAAVAVVEQTTLAEWPSETEGGTDAPAV